VRKGRPILGAIAGLLLGGFVALDLQQYAIRPLDNVTIIGLPFAGLVIGIALGVLHPLRPGRRTPPSSQPAPPQAPPPPVSTEPPPATSV